MRSVSRQNECKHPWCVDIGKVYARRHEFAIRKAIGGGGFNPTRQSEFVPSPRRSWPPSYYLRRHCALRSGLSPPGSAPSRRRCDATASSTIAQKKANERPRCRRRLPNVHWLSETLRKAPGNGPTSQIGGGYRSNCRTGERPLRAVLAISSKSVPSRR
jgi:hypothetical protein